MTVKPSLPTVRNGREFQGSSFTEPSPVESGSSFGTLRILGGF